MYTTIDNIIGKKRIELVFLIQGKEVAIISMFSDNVPYWLKEPMKVLLPTNEEKELLKVRVYMNRELNESIGSKLKLQLVSHDYVIKKNKLKHVTEVIIKVGRSQQH